MATDGCSAGSGKIVHSPKFWPNLGLKNLNSGQGCPIFGLKNLNFGQGKLKISL
jgi:hypothetical protein